MLRRGIRDSTRIAERFLQILSSASRMVVPPSQAMTGKFNLSCFSGFQQSCGLATGLLKESIALLCLFAMFIRARRVLLILR